jgi:hypothetical protein
MKWSLDFGLVLSAQLTLSGNVIRQLSKTKDQRAKTKRDEQSG